MHTAFRGLGRWMSMRAPLGAARLPGTRPSAAPSVCLPTVQPSLPSWRTPHFSRGAVRAARQCGTGTGTAAHSGGADASSRCSRSRALSGGAGWGCGHQDPAQQALFDCWRDGWSGTPQRTFRTSTAVHAAGKKSPADLVKRITRGAAPSGGPHQAKPYILDPKPCQADHTRCCPQPQAPPNETLNPEP